MKSFNGILSTLNLPEVSSINSSTVSTCFILNVATLTAINKGVKLREIWMEFGLVLNWTNFQLT